MRNLVFAGFFYFANFVVVHATTLSTPEVVVTFEDSVEGLHASFEASIDLAGLSPGGAGAPFVSRFFGVSGFGVQFTSVSSAASVEDLTTFGTSEFAFNVFGPDFFDTTNVINETGDNFGFAVVGTDLPSLVYSLPSGYVSNSPLSGAATFVDLSLADVSDLLGSFPLDFDATRTVTFRASADVDSDAKVDGSDLLAIQRSNPTLISAWESQFGVSAPVRGIFDSVPEPSTSVMLLFVGIVTLMRRHQILIP